MKRWGRGRLRNGKTSGSVYALIKELGLSITHHTVQDKIDAFLSIHPDKAKEWKSDRYISARGQNDVIQILLILFLLIYLKEKEHLLDGKL